MKQKYRRPPKPRNPMAKALASPLFRPRVVKTVNRETTRCKGYLRRVMRNADDLYSGLFRRA